MFAVGAHTWYPNVRVEQANDVYRSFLLLVVNLLFLLMSGYRILRVEIVFLPYSEWLRLKAVCCTEELRDIVLYLTIVFEFLILLYLNLMMTWVFSGLTFSDLI